MAEVRFDQSPEDKGVWLGNEEDPFSFQSLVFVPWEVF